jgi:putative flippase GtrA
MRALILEVGSYGLASAAALGVDVGLMFLLTTVAGWHHLPAAAVSFIAGGVFLYAISIRFVFRQRRMQTGVLELGSFIGLGLVGFAINLTVIYLAVDGAHVPLLFAKAIASGCTFGINYLLRRQLLFTRSA